MHLRVTDNCIRYIITNTSAHYSFSNWLCFAYVQHWSSSALLFHRGKAENSSHSRLLHYGVLQHLLFRDKRGTVFKLDFPFFCSHTVLRRGLYQEGRPKKLGIVFFVSTFASPIQELSRVTEQQLAWFSRCASTQNCFIFTVKRLWNLQKGTKGIVFSRTETIK